MRFLYKLEAISVPSLSFLIFLSPILIQSLLFPIPIPWKKQMVLNGINCLFLIIFWSPNKQVLRVTIALSQTKMVLSKQRSPVGRTNLFLSWEGAT